MNPFRPAEIRIIVLLSSIILIGSVFTMLKKQGRLSDLDLGIFTDRGNYKYELPVKREFTEPDSAGDFSPVVEISSETVPVNINKASFFDLQTLPGIGPATARNIITYRDSVGIFSTVDDLMKVN
ncbi:MAG: helix-hairpin-helix domain-containing protein, partial [candidate division Zixibacteria bacterium]